MPFEKGHNFGNRFSSENQPENNGRPKKIRSLEKLMEDVIGDEGMGEIMEALKKQASKGNVNAIQLVMDRQFGRPKQSIDLQGQISLQPQINVQPKKIDNKDNAD